MGPDSDAPRPLELRHRRQLSEYLAKAQNIYKSREQFNQIYRETQVPGVFVASETSPNQEIFTKTKTSLRKHFQPCSHIHNWKL